MRALCNSFVLEMQLICYKVAANMSFLSDTPQTTPPPPSLGALAIDMHKFLKRLSMPQESGSSSFQHLNKVGSPALPEQKPLRGFVLSSFTAAAASPPPPSSSFASVLLSDCAKYAGRRFLLRLLMLVFWVIVDVA